MGGSCAERQIYQDFADLHKDEFNFVAVADESGAEGIYNTALNDISGGKFYDIADFGGWNIVPVASAAGLILDLKPYLDEDAGFKAGAGVCYDQNLTADGKIYSVREQIELLASGTTKRCSRRLARRSPPTGAHGRTLRKQSTSLLTQVLPRSA